MEQIEKGYRAVTLWSQKVVEGANLSFQRIADASAEFRDKRTAFGAPLIGLRAEQLSWTGSAPKALRLSNSIEPTPFGLAPLGRLAR